LYQSVGNFEVKSKESDGFSDKMFSTIY